MGKSFLADNDPLCEDFHMKRAKWRVKPGKTVGSFTKQFMTIQNDGFETYFTKIPRRATKRAARTSLAKYNKHERQRWATRRWTRSQELPATRPLPQQPIRTPAATAAGLQQPTQQPRFLQTASAPSPASGAASATTTTATQTEAGCQTGSEEILR